MSFNARNSPPTLPTTKAAIRSRSPPLAPLPSLSTTLPGLTAFDRAVHVVNVSNTTTQGYNDSSQAGSSSDRFYFSPEEQLLLYGAYKQATKGDVKGHKPTFFDIAARSKWQAWSNMRGKTQDEAQDIYVDLVVKSLTKSGSHPDHHALADEILQRPLTSPLFDKELPPIDVETGSPPPTLSITKALATASTPSNQLQDGRKGSISHSIRSTVTGGVHSAAPSLYELANETFPDAEVEDQASLTNADPGYHDVTKTVAEKEVLDEDDYAAEVQKVTSTLSLPRPPLGDRHDEIGNDEGEDEDEIYQSSEEYDEDDIDDSISDSSHGSVRSFDQLEQQTSVPQSPVVEISQSVASPRQHEHNDDFVDEGVFDEEEKDDHEIEVQDLHGFPKPAADLVVKDGPETTVDKSNSSRSGSVSSGYGGSVFSDKEDTAHNTFDRVLLGQDKASNKQLDLTSPPIVPYRVNIVHDASISSLTQQELRHARIKDNTDEDSHNPTIAEPSSASASSTPSTSSTSPLLSISSATSTSPDQLVCPVSKKTAASGGVCPAAMFAQVRANTASASAASTGSEKSDSIQSGIKTEDQQIGTTGPSSRSSNEAEETAPLSPTTSIQRRAMTEPVPAVAASTADASAASSPSTTTRIGQTIASHFTALKSSLAAASARATTLALSGGSTSSPDRSDPSTSANPNAVVVRDPVTNQSFTVLCPHMASTQVLETEIVRLQTDVSVLHERLDLLQESLKVTSQTREQERRSPRGILKLVLRQGLINAVLLLIVFAVLYKRKSPIAFAILAYIGQGRKEGEASWRALMRWSADLIRTGQRNQQNMLRAGRRNGYW